MRLTYEPSDVISGTSLSASSYFFSWKSRGLVDEWMHRFPFFTQGVQRTVSGIFGLLTDRQGRIPPFAVERNRHI